MNNESHSKALTLEQLNEIAQAVRAINTYLEHNPTVQIEIRQDGTVGIVGD